MFKTTHQKYLCLCPKNERKSNFTYQRLDLIRFTSLKELNRIQYGIVSMLTKVGLISTYHDVVSGPSDGLSCNVHFKLDSTVATGQRSPRNIPTALMATMKVQLGQNKKDGRHLSTITQPTDWINNLVTVKKPDELRLCIDPRPLTQSHYLMPTLDDVLYKLPMARIFVLM